jgi:hypothetical protein
MTKVILFKYPIISIIIMIAEIIMNRKFHLHIKEF